MEKQSQPKNLASLAATIPPAGFFVACGFLFLASLAATIYFCRMMNGGMHMPGGWTMSMMWMRMPGQTWPGLAAAFIGIWVLMMIAMMMPSLMPMLLRYQRAINTASGIRLNLLTSLVGAGYYFVWLLFGIAAFGIGFTNAAFEMHQPAWARAVPFVIGVVVMIAAALQFTPWKAYHLACCRKCIDHNFKLKANAGTAWRHGLQLGLHCCYCCFSLMMILLTVGMMDIRAMALVMIAVTAERLLPSGKRAAVTIGGVAFLAGLFLLMQASGIG